jgi:hypothetical protein
VYWQARGQNAVVPFFDTNVASDAPKPLALLDLGGQSPATNMFSREQAFLEMEDQVSKNARINSNLLA